MDYIQKLDLQQEGALKPIGIRMQYLFAGTSCVVIATEVPAGGHALGRHTHDRDQLYYVMSGSMELEFGDEQTSVSADSAVLIPAGLPHHNYNPTGEPERHLEVIAPGLLPNEKAATLTDSLESGGKSVTVQRVDPVKHASADRSWDWLITRESGATAAMGGVVKIPPGDSGPGLHVHEFDQFFFVLEGEMSVQIALGEYVVPSDHLVILPAGVPHRQWNAGEVTERHLSFNVPVPASLDSHTWDTAVSFAAA